MKSPIPTSLHFNKKDKYAQLDNEHRYYQPQPFYPPNTDLQIGDYFRNNICAGGSI